MILSIDTFSENLGIAIFSDETLLYHLSIYKHKPFSEFLVKKLDDIFKELSLNKKEIKKVIVNKGPGSYTGLRVGISVAKTIAYSLNIPIYSYTSLSALSYKYRFFNGDVLIGINAGKGEVYSQIFKVNYDDVVQISDIQLLKKDKFLELKENFKLTVIKGFNLVGKNIILEKEDLAIIGKEYALKKDLKEDIFHLEPIYVRDL